MLSRNTRIIYWGMGLNLGITAALVFAGVALRAPGAETGIVALTLALVAEVYYLKGRAARASCTVTAGPAPARRSNIPSA